MAWRDDLLPAKLGGVEFLYRSVRDTGGRRVADFEFPNRQEPFSEDLGPMAKRFRVDAFLIGDFYHVRLQELLDVLDVPGPHTFQHPYRGTFQVKLTGGYEVTQSDTEGGFARISFTLIEAGTSFPLVFIDTGSRVRRAAAVARETLSANTGFDLLGAIKDVINSALNGLGDALRAVNKVNGKIGAALGTLDSAAFLIDELSDGLQQLVNTPQALMNSLTGVLDSVVGLVKDFVPDTLEVGVEGFPTTQVDVLMESFDDVSGFASEPDTIPTATPQAQIEETAHAEINLAMKGGMLAATADALTVLAFESASQAAAVQNSLVAVFDDLLGLETLPAETYEAFAALKAATVEHLTVVQQSLPDLATYTPAVTLPALVVAYELYGDAERDTEIVERNNVRHPNFLPGGRVLEVLSQ